MTVSYQSVIRNVSILSLLEALFAALIVLVTAF